MNSLAVLLAFVEQLELEPWIDRAACHDVDQRVFFPERGETQALAKRICKDCEVRHECLDYALRANEKHGVWGGLSVRQRRQIRRERRLAA